MKGGVLMVLLLTNGIFAEREDLQYNEIEDSSKNVRPKRQETSELCDFGSDNEQSLCDWINRNNSLKQWSFGAGSLSNWIGGPTTDANDDTKAGYVFFETSQLTIEARTQLNAFLESPILPKTLSEGKCISFNYAIDGLSAAGLRVLLHPVIDDGLNNFDRVLWSAKDSTDKKWQRAEFLYTFNEEHQIIFEGVAKDSLDPFRKFRGYIAVDNIARKPGSQCKGHCTFEGGFCSWINVETDDFQWSLGRGSSNPSTGPTTDRSSYIHGGIQGGYAYIDSSFPRKPGDIAILASDDFAPTGPDTPICLRFWTHMYGNGIGSLTVMIDKEGVRTKIWEITGETGNIWHQAEILISSAVNFQILFQAKIGKNNLGDIAIDDVSISQGSCSLSPQIAAVRPGDCRFQTDECGWANTSPRERQDDIDWDRISGQATHPTIYDHTFGTDKGYFMALARSTIQRPGSRAWLYSKEFKGITEPICMSFYYIMNEPFIDNNGPSLGSLSVFTKSLDKSNQIVMNDVWKVYNYQGPSWRYAQTPINEVNFTVVIEGTWGSTRTNGFIAFDDIAFFDGPCSPIPAYAAVRAGECHFDRDTCGWTNETISGSKRKTESSWKLTVMSRRPANLVDNTFGSPEGYVYFDLFNHNAENNIVRLVSPIIPASENSLCMSFWFAAFGAGEDGDLKIIRRDNSSGETTSELLWELMAKDVDTIRPSWMSGQIGIDSSSDFTIVLEGMASNGGFAIDDIAFSDGKCATRPEKADKQQQQEAES